jgi:DNA-binding NarL/FixJ family response regulator
MTHGPTRLLVLGGDEFVLTTMRAALQLAPEVSVLGMRDRPGSLADAIRDTGADIAVIEATGDTQRSCYRLREVRDACRGALIVVVVAEFDMELFEEATRRGALACLAGPGPATALQSLLARTRSEAVAPGHLRLATPEAPRAPKRLERMPDPAPKSLLTAREQEILGLVAEGRTNPQISRELWLAEQTVKFHLSKIYRKLGVSNRTEASRHALLHGLSAPRVARLEPPRRRRATDDVRAAGAAGL